MEYWVNVYSSWEGKMYFGTPYQTREEALEARDTTSTLLATISFKIPEES